MDRAHTTNASRVMLPCYPAFFLAFGVALLFTPRHVMLATPSFRYAAGVMPLATWGFLMVAVAGLQLIALMVHRREWYIGTLGVALVTMLAWVGVFIMSAAHGGAPWSAPIWPAFVGAACWATLLSLASGES